MSVVLISTRSIIFILTLQLVPSFTFSTASIFWNPRTSNSDSRIFLSMMNNFEKLSTMKATQIKNYGPINEMISVEDGVAVPSLSSLSKKKQKDYLILKTLAVSLAPGDVRVLSGLTKELQGPKSMPYIPGGDCCGIIVDISDEKGKHDSIDFKKGDLVAARFYDFPFNCLAEYAIVHKAVCEKVQDQEEGVSHDKNVNITNEAAAALASATPAILIADAVKKGDRVLVLGAGGGLGSHLCQILREREVSFLVGVSKDPNRLLTAPISCDVAIDYTKENVWNKEEFIANPFDVIIDLAGGGWPTILNEKKGGKKLIIKSAKEGGRFVTPTPDNPIFEIHSIWAALKVFLFPSLWRYMKTRTYSRKSLPKYSYGIYLPNSRDVITRTFREVRQGKLSACFEGPFPFTTEGVKEAFLVQKSRHAKGKVIVKVADC